MSGARRVLILSAGAEDSGDLRAMSGALAAQGASVVVRSCEGDGEALLDAIAAADVVVCWS